MAAVVLGPGMLSDQVTTGRLDLERSAAMLERLSPSAEEMATEWIDAFGAALAGGPEIALSGLFAPDSHWRNLLGISWHFATFSGSRTLARELLQRAADARASGFRIDTAALAPRHAIIAGREVIEAVICFDTVNGPGMGALRLLPGRRGYPRRGRFPPCSISTRSARRVRTMPRADPTAAILSVPIGPSIGRRCPNIAIASPTFSLSVAVMPVFPPPSS
jgi:hypothetical protein